MNLGLLFFDLAVLFLVDFLVFKKLFWPILIEYRQISALIKTGVFATGQVVGFDCRENIDGRQEYAPIVMFMAANGKTYKVRSTDFKYKKPLLDSFVEVWYSPDNPLHAIVDAKSQMDFKALLIGFLAVVLLGLNFGILYRIVF